MSLPRTIENARGLLKAPKRPKFGNRKTVVDGLTFDSAAEARRWGELRLLERAGEIRDLRRQVRYPLHFGEAVIGHIVPDFLYISGHDVVCEDVKSPATITPMFKWKAKHFLAEYGIAVKVVMS